MLHVLIEMHRHTSDIIMYICRTRHMYMMTWIASEKQLKDWSSKWYKRESWVLTLDTFVYTLIRKEREVEQK